MPFPPIVPKRRKSLMDPVQFGCTMVASKAMMDDTAFNVRKIVAERMRSQIEELVRERYLTIIEGTVRIESEPFSETWPIRGRGFRRLLEWLRIVEPREHVFEGERFRMTARAQ